MVGPRDYKTIVEKQDFRAQGSWRFINISPKGERFTFNGMYKEVIRDERIVSTFEFDAAPGHILIQTITFEEQGEKTKVTAKSLYQSVEDLEGMIQSGMEWGLNQSYERLEELLEKVKKSS